MTKLNRLKKEALESCKFRGHKMSKFCTSLKNERANAVCIVCYKMVYVNTKPATYSINIGGEAVAFHCNSQN